MKAGSQQPEPEGLLQVETLQPEASKLLCKKASPQVPCQAPSRAEDMVKLPEWLGRLLPSELQGGGSFTAVYLGTPVVSDKEVPWDRDRPGFSSAAGQVVT